MKHLRVAVSLAVVAVTAGVALWLSFSGRLSVTGDEPHYLVMADAVVHDATFDLRNAYAREARTHHIYDGSLNPHVLIVEHRWGGYHEPGLALLLAIPYLLGGSLGAKLALSAAAGLMAWSVFGWLRHALSEKDAAWLTLGLLVSAPIAFGASQVYPDLPAGAVVTLLTLWLLDRASERPAAKPRATGWAVYWLASGALPWLNAKFVVVTAVLTVGAIGLVWRHGARRMTAAWATCGLVAVGPLALAAYHWWASGTPLGVRGLDELRTWPLRALMMALGLHLDQAQGLFFAQPLLAAGVVALVPFARRRPRFAMFWAALYGSLILPNALELARYGGGGPAGRFGWSAEWLWVVPLGSLLAEHRGRASRYVPAAAIAALVYQALLACRWLPEPAVLFTTLGDTLDARDSLFPVGMRRALPSFYFWDFESYLTYGPNLVACAGTAALVAVGALAGTRRGPRPARQGTRLLS